MMSMTVSSLVLMVLSLPTGFEMEKGRKRRCAVAALGKASISRLANWA
jgi:hypothetical protein